MNIISAISQINTKYSGITKILRKNLYQNPQLLDSFYSATKEAGQVIGSVPKDLLDLGTRSNCSKKETAKKFHEIFSIIGEELQGFESKKLETAQNVNVKNFIGTYLPKLAKIDIQPERIPRIIAEMRKKLLPAKNIINEYNNTMSERFTGILQNAGIIHSSETAKLTYIGQGVFKNAFKLEILDKEGKNIIHPKVLLSFKQESTVVGENNAILNLLKTYIKSMPKGEFISKLDKMLASVPSKVIPQEQRCLYKETLIKMYDDIHQNKGIEKFESLINTNIQYQAKYNGILPEGNIIMFLKHAAGKPLEKTNFINIAYIQPNKNIGIAEYSDDLLPKVTKQVDMKKLGLFHDDLIKNKDNQVGERIIDYGNIKKVNNSSANILTENPIARRIYNKIQQISRKDDNKTQALRIEYWNKLYDKAIALEISNHNEILKALEVSKEHIKDCSKLNDYRG